MRKKAARGFRLLMMGVVIASGALAGGCDSGSPEGTMAKVDPANEKAKQDAMREYMSKQKNNIPGQGTNAKAK